MSGISTFAQRRPRFTLLSALVLVLVGLWLALDFPSTEEPQITIRTATVLSFVSGASVERMERLVVKPIEESIVGIPEVKRVKTTVRPGFSFTYVDLHPDVAPDRLPAIWQRLRSRMSDLRPTLPEGATGPIVDDEFGRVAVLTFGLTGASYRAGELRAEARRIRDSLIRFPGVDKVSLHGVRDEQIQVVVDAPALAAKGVTPAALAEAVARRNVIEPAGFVEIGGSEIALRVSGDVATPDDLGTTPVALPGGGALPLSQLARIERVPLDPPLTAAFVDGAPAVVVAVSMAPGLNVVSFAERLRGEIGRIQREIPAGMDIVPITDQARIVTQQLGQVSRVFLETTAIVMGVVVLFLGLRTGLIVGAIVPTTVLGTLAVMRLAGIDLHIISVGAIIIALGLFVDNAIVVAEDMERRLANGESREQAAVAAGGSMFVPLLVSSLAIILTFMPLVLSKTDTGEYLRSLGIVMAIALSLSLLLAVTVTPLLCQRFARTHAHMSRAARAVEALTDWYRGKVRWILDHKAIYVGAMLGLLFVAGWLFTLVPSELMPASERKQIQMSIELPSDTSTVKTVARAAEISRALADRLAFPQVVSHAIHMGDGGPRFILALNPPTPAAHRAYAVVSLSPTASHAVTIAALRITLAERFPDVRFEPKRFSMGSTDSGLAVFRLIGGDDDAQRSAAAKLIAALRAVPGMSDVTSDDERATWQVDVAVDQAKARAAGLASVDVARSLDMLLAGKAISQFRDGDTVLPVILRGEPTLRQNIEGLIALPVHRADGRGAVPLGQVASVSLKSQPSVVQRVNQQRALTIGARHASLTAQEIADLMAGVVASIEADTQVMVELGGEIEENAGANDAIVKLLPACVLAMFLLFVWQFESVRKSLIVMASIPFVAIGASLGLTFSGTALTFVGTLGLLALAGIIVNNAVLLLDAIEENRAGGLPARQAIEDAAAKRLRPIVMTKLVCILGLVPLWLFGGVVWKSLAVVMMGGLALGTLITLGLIPALYAALYRIDARDQ
jgi:multidrug efflux pump subunit AcrB